MRKGAVEVSCVPAGSASYAATIHMLLLYDGCYCDKMCLPAVSVSYSAARADAPLRRGQMQPVGERGENLIIFTTRAPARAHTLASTHTLTGTHLPAQTRGTHHRPGVHTLAHKHTNLRNTCTHARISAHTNNTLDTMLCSRAPTNCASCSCCCASPEYGMAPLTVW